MHKYEQLVQFGSILTFTLQVALQTGDGAEDLAVKKNTAAIC